MYIPFCYEFDISLVIHMCVCVGVIMVGFDMPSYSSVAEGSSVQVCVSVVTGQSTNDIRTS